VVGFVVEDYIVVDYMVVDMQTEQSPVEAVFVA